MSEETEGGLRCIAANFPSASACGSLDASRRSVILGRVDDGRRTEGGRMRVLVMPSLQPDAVQERHAPKNGLCGWCYCEWPCDAWQLADWIERKSSTEEPEEDA